MTRRRLTHLIVAPLLIVAGTLTANAQVEIGSKPQVGSLEEMLDFSRTLLRRPYRNGAEGPYAFDCSGFTRYCYKQAGITLARSSKDQSTMGKRIRKKKRLKPGDLVFYKGSSGHDVGHVGIVIEKGKDKKTFNFIHASSSVGITITSSETSYFKDRYVKAMRITTDKAIKKAKKEDWPETDQSPELRKKDKQKQEKNAKKDKQDGTAQKDTTPNTPKDGDGTPGLKTLTGKNYVVKKGDTLYNIAKRAGCTVDQLKKWNGLTDNQLKLGQKLIIRGDK